jgi:eukaryotic-like serine/threonine-protein kinase
VYWQDQREHAAGSVSSGPPPCCSGVADLAVQPGRSSWAFDEGAPIAPGRTVLREIGGGSRYEALLVWDERLFAIMVAKVLRPDQAEDEHALRELRREAEALERLAHPVIVRGFDAVLDGPHPHLLIEHLEGPTLRRVIKKGGPLPLQQVLPLALHVAAALHFMAGERMVHLDVKPDNIVMGVPPRLIDLSIASDLDRAARLRGPIGTDSYMAPEQCGEGGPIGPASDVFGLGATLFHALTGGKPFAREPGARDSDDPAVRFPQLSREPLPLPRRLPAALIRLVERMLARDPAYRPAAAQVAAELEPLVAALPRRIPFGRRRA